MGTIRLALDFSYNSDRQKAELMKIISEMIQQARLDSSVHDLKVNPTVGRRESFK